MNVAISIKISIENTNNVVFVAAIFIAIPDIDPMAKPMMLVGKFFINPFCFILFNIIPPSNVRNNVGTIIISAADFISDSDNNIIMKEENLRRKIR